MDQFKLISEFQPTGDQPQAIKSLVAGVKAGLKHRVLLGVTGSGKTFTMANVIAQLNCPTLVISHNKTLAAQLFQEYRAFFPKNSVEYFVSYYDYYQPEAYLPQTDTYIEKDADINEEIDKLRLSATTALLTRKDVIVVASVSCIYNLGSPQEYRKTTLELKKRMKVRREDLIKRLIQLFYERSDFDLRRGTFRVRGDTLDIYPAYLDYAFRLELFGDQLQEVSVFDPMTGEIEKSNTVKLKTDLEASVPDSSSMDTVVIFPAKHYVTAEERQKKALQKIRQELNEQVQKLKEENKLLEAHRLYQKTNYDLELIEEIGYCKGIENYSRYFDNRAPGEPPYTLLDFFDLEHKGDWLLIIDESHMTIPQLRGMFWGERSRKETLIEYGFRLPSALDNRPLRMEEFFESINQVIYTSATPGEWEVQQAVLAARAKRKTQNSKLVRKENRRAFPHSGIVEQLIRPTGLLDPQIEIRGTKNQVLNLITEIRKRVERQERVLVTTLTKRMAEDLSSYLLEQDIKVHYLHADVATLERTDILEDLRRGKYDVVVGINLLREGLDLPEVSLVAILDADKEGFLRSEKSLIQTMGRAARHVHGKVIMYADQVTGSMRRAIDEVHRRRRVQEEYNRKYGVVPQSIRKPIREKLVEPERESEARKTSPIFSPWVDDEVSGRWVFGRGSGFVSKSKPEEKKLLRALRDSMRQSAEDLNFERAAELRDQIAIIEGTSRKRTNQL